MSIYDEFLIGQNQYNDCIYGVATGIVKENWNEENPGTVKVEFHLGEKGKNLSGWIPVMSPYAGNAFGYYALPEVESEIVVAFQMGDRNCPIVIGTLWSGKNKLPQETANDKNTVKKLLTKGGCEIVFDEKEKKETIKIHTPKKLNMLIEDENETITIGDEKGENIIKIDSKNGEIAITAKSKIVLKADSAAITIDGKGKSIKAEADKIDINAKQGLTLKGQNTNLEGGSMVGIKGQSSVKAESGGIFEIKGSMTKIN